MPAWALLTILFATWYLQVVKKAYWTFVIQARQGIPRARWSGGSLLPEILLGPLVSWGAAALVDRHYEPWGTWLVVGVHFYLAISALVAIRRDRDTLKSLEPC